MIYIEGPCKVNEIQPHTAVLCFAVVDALGAAVEVRVALHVRCTFSAAVPAIDIRFGTVLLAIEACGVVVSILLGPCHDHTHDAATSTAPRPTERGPGNRSPTSKATAAAEAVRMPHPPASAQAHSNYLQPCSAPHDTCCLPHHAARTPSCVLAAHIRAFDKALVSSLHCTSTATLHSASSTVPSGMSACSCCRRVTARRVTADAATGAASAAPSAAAAVAAAAARRPLRRESRRRRARRRARGARRARRNVPAAAWNCRHLQWY